MSMLRPYARTTAPDGREWEIYAYKLRMPWRKPPDPDPVGPTFSTIQADALVGLVDGIVYVLAWIPRLLLRLCIDLPVGAVRAVRSDVWTVEAISWAPFRSSYRWSTTREYRGQVLAQVEGGLARGETPRPSNAERVGTDD